MTEHNEDTAERRERLAQAGGRGPTVFNPRYSLFVRRMRLVLPIISLIIIAVVFSWSSMNDAGTIPTAEDAKAPQTIGKNELLMPRFESTDTKEQPFTITAKRAIQGRENEDLVILEEPVADILLSGGDWVAIEALQGAFRQDNQQLMLRGKVNLFHDKGYRLETEELHIDLQKSAAWSEKDIYAQGPAGTLNAKGLRGNSADNHLVFNGPAKLVLNTQGGL